MLVENVHGLQTTALRGEDFYPTTGELRNCLYFRIIAVSPSALLALDVVLKTLVVGQERKEVAALLLHESHAPFSNGVVHVRRTVELNRNRTEQAIAISLLGVQLEAVFF